MNQPKSEETIFCEALEIPIEDRAEFLRSACAGDPELLDSVKGLLQLHDTEEDFLATPAVGFATAAVDEKTGDRIGSYVLECQIGEGGFGVVWQAKQLEPIKRRVALKIVKLGMDSESIVERFNDERQTLALMNHPNIATVLDAGVTDGGRPYFAMELVDGKSLDRFCDENQLSLDATLEILITVCRAVQHAHQKGIVHRDLKPTNILIASSDGQIVPKVIDFGIATAIQNKDVMENESKGHGLAGTPQYMSPEQWQKQADIDTRSDIYSLGVVLFRLLTGTVPEFKDLSKRQFAPLPSSAKKLNKPVIGFDIDDDLDWITHRAMSFNREDRYQSASELAMDIERYLNGQVVFAHPGGATYRFKKFIRRNKIVFGSGVMTVLAMVVAIFGSTWGMVHANHQRKVADEQTLAAQQNEKEAIRLKEIAEAEARKLRVVANVLKNMLPEANPFRGMKSGFQIRQHLDQLVESVDALSSEPELEADVRITAARVYENLERYGWARLQYTKAHEIRVKELGEHHPKTLFCLVGAASCNIQLHRLPAAEKTIQKVLNESEGGLAPRVHMNALRTLRKIRDEQGRYQEAFEIAQQALEYSKSTFKSEIFGHIHIANEYSISARKIGRFEEAEKIVRKSLKRLVHDHPDKKFVIANTKHRLAEILIDIKRFDEAKELAQSFIDIQSMTLGENDEYVVRGLIMLSEIHRLEDDLLVAEQLALEASERAETHPKDQFKIRSNAYRQLAKILTELDLKRAADTWETAIENRWQDQGARGSIADDLLEQAHIFEQLDSYEQAANRASRAIEILEYKKAGKSKLEKAYRFYAELLEQLGRKEAAEGYLEKANLLTQDSE